jgi:hypothetical protein
MIQMSNDELVTLYKLASVGKLVGGLVHNLNGSMQNLGLDVEMARYSLRDESKWDNNTVQGIIARLRRMEEEFEKINSLIRITLTKTGDYNGDSNILNIYEFLKQELSFLHSNLYFKHNVKTEIVSENDPPSILDLAQDSLIALGWFIQSLVEELESQKLRDLTIKIINDNSTLSILFQTHGGKLSDQFTAQLKDAVPTSDLIKSNNKNLGIFISIMIFKNNGVALTIDSKSSHSNVAINFPKLG